MRNHVDDYVDRLQTALDDLDRHLLARLRDALIRVYRDDKQVFIIGNGGSSSTASHMAADLAKNTIGPNMKRFKVATLSENAAIVTALANDVGYENVFYEQLVNVIHAGDVLIAVSASGNSPNVLKAIKYAQRQSAEVVGLLGFGGGGAAELADIAIVVKSQSYGIVEDVHLSINHMLVECFREDLAASRPWAV
jgi:D-sedoheptulose 7-phosphate isomerase